MLDKKIKYFITVAEAGSFSAAARKLFLSQSALSQQVSLLEEEIGIPLLDRSGYRPVLTDAGRKYYKFCRETEDQYQDLLKELTSQRSKNMIRIAFTGAYENKELIRFTSYFRKQHEGISFSYVEGSFAENVRDLTEGSVDVAFGLKSSFEKVPGIVTRDLYPYQMCVITAFDHPLSERESLVPEDLRKEKFVVLSRKFGKGFYRQFMKSFTQDGGSREQLVKETDTFDELLVSVSIGEGIAIISPNVADDNAVRRIPLLHSHHHATYVVAYHESAPESSAILKDFLSKAEIYFQHFHKI